MMSFWEVLCHTVFGNLTAATVMNQFAGYYKFFQIYAARNLTRTVA